MNLTWACHICGDERSDQFIGVYTQDIGSGFGLPPGLLRQNIRYCLDRQHCVLHKERYQAPFNSLKTREDDRHD